MKINKNLMGRNHTAMQRSTQRQIQIIIRARTSERPLISGLVFPGISGRATIIEIIIPGIVAADCRAAQDIHSSGNAKMQIR